MIRVLTILSLSICGCAVEQPPPSLCSHACPICKSDNLRCSGGSASSDYPATCLQACDTTADCQGGARCVALLDGTGEGTCVGPSSPPLCPGVVDDPGWHVDLAPASCVGAVLQQPYNQRSNHTAGYELIGCPNGCDPGGNTDGGVAAAHCR